MRWAEDKAKTALHEHYRKVCAECRTLISQCRCRSASKVEKLGLCDSCDPESAEKRATLYQQAVNEAVGGVVAVKRKPSFPNLVDEYEPTDPRLWKQVLEVASGDRRDLTIGDRTINSPNDGRGYRGMPSNPKGIAWAVKQFKGFNGNFKKQAKLPEESTTWEIRLGRMKAGGIEVTNGPDPEAEKLISEGKIRLAGTDGLRWYWDLVS